MTILANWNDRECWENSIQYQLSDYEETLEWTQDGEGDWINVDEDGEKEMLDITWMRLFRYKCDCGDFLVIFYPAKYNSTKYNIDYCKNCEVKKGGWYKAAYNVHVFKSPDEINNAFENGMRTSEENRKILDKIYPNI